MNIDSISNSEHSDSEGSDGEGSDGEGSDDEGSDEVLRTRSGRAFGI